jgi:hypothetical protein
VTDIAPASARGPIALGLFGALAGSSCCVLPLAAAWAGLGGAWISGARAFAPLSPFFLLLTVGAFSWSFHRVYLRPPCCLPQDPTARRRQRIAFWSALVGAKALLFGPVFYALLARA